MKTIQSLALYSTMAALAACSASPGDTLSGGPSDSDGGFGSDGASGMGSDGGGDSSTSPDGGSSTSDSGASGGDGGASAMHVDNPFVGATFYVNPAWAANVTGTTASDPTVTAQLATVATYSTAVWLDAMARIAPTDGTMGLGAHLDAALTQATGNMPVEITLVVYDLPGRDCAALASNGELPATAAGLDTYEHMYIDPIVALLGEAKYSALRIVTVVEPDSLPNLVTNQSIAACATSGPFYEQGVQYALDKLHAITNVYTYLDSGHSGWLGWTSNSGPAATEFAKVAQTTSAGFASVDGFITDTANYTPVLEPNMTATQMVGSQPVDSAMFYQYNPEIDEGDFAADMYQNLTAVGFPSSIGMLIDTSRNGWGGAARPAAASSSTDVNTFVNASKIDRRAHRGLWCNVSGSGLGAPPQAAPPGHDAAHLDAYVWIKPPGESDGTSAAVVNNMGKMSDPMCNPTFTTSYGVLTGAMPNSPLAGAWFAAQLLALVQNAYPAVPQ